MEWEIWRIIMQYYPRRLNIEALIWHIKCLKHHLLGDSDKHTHHKSVNRHYPSASLPTSSSAALEKNTQNRFSCTGYWVVRYDIHPNFSKWVKYLNFSSTKSAILIILISLTFHLALKHSNSTLSFMLRKLASKLVRAYGGSGAYGWADGSAYGGAQVQDEPSHLTRLDLICLGAGCSSETIGIQKMMLCRKFARITQPRLPFRTFIEHLVFDDFGEVFG